MLSLNLNPFPVLETERLILRRTTLNDADDLFLLRSDKKLMEFVNRPLAASIEDIHIWHQKVNDNLENNAGILWAISLKDNDKMAGNIGYHRIEFENYRAEVGYMLLTEYHGKGIMQEALQAVIDYGFNTLKLHSIEADINPFNDASRNLLLRSGFQKEAYFRENFFYNGKFLDSEIYGLLKSDWKR